MKFLPRGTTEEVLVAAIRRNAETALEEDVGTGDVSAALIDPATRASARVITREAGVISGLPWVIEVCRQVDDRIRVETLVEDGDPVPADTALYSLEGPAAALLTAERPALNFLQRLRLPGQ